MGNVNKLKLDNIFNFKTFLDGQIVWLNQLDQNTFRTEQFKLLCFISENVRMNLNYWLSCNLEDYSNNFSGVYRNLRYSVESYYDLFNLVFDDTYVAVLKKNSSYAEMEQIDYYNLKNVYNKFKVDDTYYFTIKDKANIATIKNNLRFDIQNMLKEISIKGSGDAHPDVYQPNIESKLEIIEKLMDFECIILAYAVELYIYSFNKKYNTNYYLNVQEELRKLKILNYSLPTQVDNILSIC